MQTSTEVQNITLLYHLYHILWKIARKMSFLISFKKPFFLEKKTLFKVA